MFCDRGERYARGPWRRHPALRPAHRLLMPSVRTSCCEKVRKPAGGVPVELAKFMRTASVLKGCTHTHPKTPPSPDVAKINGLLSGCTLGFVLAILTSP